MTNAKPEITNEELSRFIQNSPSAFHAVACIARMLETEGFTFLSEQSEWKIAPHGCYFTIRNGSSIIAWKVGNRNLPLRFQMTAAHTDAPTFKVKHNPCLAGQDGYLRLNTEAYGGMIDYTWLDRPLTLAGRVLVKTENKIESKLVHFDKDLLIIPSLAIHMNHQVNKGMEFNRQVDLLPLASAGMLEPDFLDSLISKELGINAQSILSRDLFLVNRQKPLTWGAEGEFFSAPKLDNLQGTFACLKAFLAQNNNDAITVFASFDNEEVGSNTKQGAMSTFLHDALLRTCLALGASQEDYLQALARSFMVSCDNAHALHPNHPEKSDAGNRSLLNKGIVIKEAANQKYTTDAFSRAAFKAICDEAKVPTQHFANRSDMSGGSTLGNLSNIQVSVHAVDVGMPQLAMHSSFETTGSQDTALGIDALRAFYEANLQIEDSSRIEL